ncbi:metal-dependent transcriptional regulator [Corynebacterium glyciniphilum]|uniref:metal-dependent transcriptional regulator n=1 Tax=Corynebacterium glyciniphilum TaxID=1404244 RepID=UPI003FD15E95
MSPEITRVAEDYLTLIWKADEWPDDGRRPTTTDLAAALGVTLSTVSANLKRLARERLIDYEPYGAIALTADGEQIALEVVRRHRIIETFLVEHLGLPWDQVHDEADQLEHAASDRLIDRMDAILGYPQVDPHGDPVPRQGATTPVSATVLSARAAGAPVQVVRVSDENPDILRFLSDRGIAIGSVIHVDVAMSSTGLMTVRHDDHTLELSTPIATSVHVTPA